MLILFMEIYVDRWDAHEITEFAEKPIAKLFWNVLDNMLLEGMFEVGGVGTLIAEEVSQSFVNLKWESLITLRVIECYLTLSTCRFNEMLFLSIIPQSLHWLFKSSAGFAFILIVSILCSLSAFFEDTKLAASNDWRSTSVSMTCISSSVVFRSIASWSVSTIMFCSSNEIELLDAIGNSSYNRSCFCERSRLRWYTILRSRSHNSHMTLE